MGVMGLAPSEYYNLTVREFLLVYRGYQEREEWQNYRTGMILSALINPNLKKNAQPTTPQDFFHFRMLKFAERHPANGRHAAPNPPPPRKQSWQEIEEALLLIFPLADTAGDNSNGSGSR